jgi:hypothetical protein
MDNPIDFSKLSAMNPDLLIYFMNVGAGMGFYPLDGPPRIDPAPAKTHFAVHPDQLKQTIKGIGFEIMLDLEGRIIAPQLPDMAWEFWEEE